MYRPVHDSRVMAFLEHGNVQKGDSIGLEVCLVEGNDDASPSHCGSFTMTSDDG